MTVSTASKRLRVLVVEDSEDDAFILLRELERGGFELTSERVDTKKAMAAALEKPWDVIISDYLMPGFGGLDALALVKEKQIDIPFMIVSGVIGEDTAVNAMKQGAHDYVMKRNLARLAPSIERELREAESRRERRRAEEALRKSQALNSAILNSALDSIITIDHEGIILEFNPTAEKTFGYTRAQAIGKSMADLIIPPSLRGAHRRGMEYYLETGNSTVLNKRIELAAMRADGSEFPAELVVTRISLDGPPIFTGYIRDITERRQAESDLFASEVRFRRVIESDMVGIMFWDEKGNVTDANEAFLKVVGYKKHHVVAGELSWENLTPPEYAALDRKVLEELAAREACTPFEKEYIRRDGRRVPVLVGAAKLGLEFGRDRGVCFVLDLTDRKRAEEAQNLLAAIVEYSDDAIIGKALDGTILSWNAGAERMYGYRAEEAMGQPMTMLVAGDHSTEMYRSLEKIKAGAHIDHLETVRRKKDGSIFHVALTISPIKDAAGRIIGASAIERDITVRRQEEETRLKLIKELSEALANIKTLKGLLPICASCKKIRDDRGYWQKVESYISEHTQAEFTHGICPDCLQRLYPQYIEKRS